jgi:ADP-ribose pyrophosphatase YjhB (NUDIX family)
VSERSFPRKRVAAGALVHDESGWLLLVKPTYRDYWSIPGGVIEAGESPRDGLAREVREELGIDLPIGRLIAVDYTSAAEDSDDSLQFLFDWGRLDAARVGTIRLPPAELSAFRFAAREEALALLGGRLARRMPACLRAWDAGRTVYLHDGVE